jgi:hypothetical protein
LGCFVYLPAMCGHLQMTLLSGRTFLGVAITSPSCYNFQRLIKGYNHEHGSKRPSWPRFGGVNFASVFQGYSQSSTQPFYTDNHKTALNGPKNRCAHTHLLFNSDTFIRQSRFSRTANCIFHMLCGYAATRNERMFDCITIPTLHRQKTSLVSV